MAIVTFTVAVEADETELASLDQAKAIMAEFEEIVAKHNLSLHDSEIDMED